MPSPDPNRGLWSWNFAQSAQEVRKKMVNFPLPLTINIYQMYPPCPIKLPLMYSVSQTQSKSQLELQIVIMSTLHRLSLPGHSGFGRDESYIISKLIWNVLSSRRKNWFKPSAAVEIIWTPSKCGFVPYPPLRNHCAVGGLCCMY